MTPMAKIDLPYVQRFKDRHGKVRHYYRRPGIARVTLPGVPGSTEFMAAYAEAHDRAPKIDHAAARVRPRSITALIAEYYRSADFLALQPQTQANYRNILDRFRSRFGDRGATTIQPKHFNSIFHEMADRPGAVRNLRRRLMKAFSVAVELGWRDDNPVRESKSRKARSPGFIAWTDDDIARFEAHWPSGSRERLALALLLYTGVRRSDVVGLGQQHIEAGRLRLVQVKTKKPIRIPLHPTLKIETDQHKGLTFLVTQYGAPFTAAGFTAWFVERADKAGLTGKTPHGLRKAAGRRLAEAGATAKEIAAILGHSTLDEVETYTRDADQTQLADAAMKKLVGGEG